MTSPMHNRSRRLGAALITVLGLAFASLVWTAGPASAADGTMTFDGRGYGHGRGMSQYGAQGYAKNFGWNSGQILDHYYGGPTVTRAGYASQAVSAPVSPTFVRVRLQRMSGRPTRVSLANGSLKLDNGAIRIDPSAKAVEIRRTAGGTLEFRTGSSCTTGFGDVWTPTTETVIDIGKSGVSDSATVGDHLAVCAVPSPGYSLTDNVVLWYPGSIRAQVVGSTQETMNITTIEKQLRSIVPNESPASWLPAALQAQTVAARSYALAGDSRYSYADTCDTIFCQVYLGWFGNRGGSIAPTTHPNTDAAIEATQKAGSDTDGLVRLTSSNRIARTEFSSTSGGWTAGGTFPAVEDKGDVVSPVHTWTRTVSVTPLEVAYGQGGKLKTIDVTKRNGLGVGGGRVIEARLVFTNGVTRTVSGNTVRSSLGLLSDWFTPRCGAEALYIDATFKLFLGRAARPADIEGWCGAVRTGARDSLTATLSVSDEWAGVQINGLYRKILGRDADASGRSYWLGRVRDGLRMEDIASYFYGGDEYFSRSGRTNRGYVERLYRDLLGRPADAGGRDYWVSRLDNGILTRDAVAANFYASIESRTTRVESLYRQILGRSADASGRAYWVDQLLSLGDVKLSAYLAASQEYYNRVTR